MKKQHLYRTSAILLFLCILLGILPQHVLQTNAAENGSLPKEGVLYTLSCADSNKQIFSLGIFNQIQYGSISRVFCRRNHTCRFVQHNIFIFHIRQII